MEDLLCARRGPRQRRHSVAGTQEAAEGRGAGRDGGAPCRHCSGATVGSRLSLSGGLPTRVRVRVRVGGLVLRGWYGVRLRLCSGPARECAVGSRSGRAGALRASCVWSARSCSGTPPGCRPTATPLPASPSTTFGSQERALSRSSASRSPGTVKRTGATHVNHVSGVPLTVIVAVCISAIVV